MYTKPTRHETPTVPMNTHEGAFVHRFDGHIVYCCALMKTSNYY